MLHFKHTVELMNKFRYNYFYNTWQLDVTGSIKTIL